MLWDAAPPQRSRPLAHRKRRVQSVEKIVGPVACVAAGVLAGRSARLSVLCRTACGAKGDRTGSPKGRYRSFFNGLPVQFADILRYPWIGEAFSRRRSHGHGSHDEQHIRI